MTKYAKQFGVKAWRRRNNLAAQRRRTNVAAGLRCDGKTRVGRKPCGCLMGSCMKCRKTVHSRKLEKLVKQMHADHVAGLGFGALERKYGRYRSGIRDLFTRRGLWCRPPRSKKPALGYGVRIPEPTLEEIKAAVAAMTRMRVPSRLTIHWRRWNLKKRYWFVKLARQKFPSTRPQGPFSRNVIPFDYGTPLAHKLAEKLNRGRNSQTKRTTIRMTSEGVIYRGEFFHWGSGMAYVRGQGWRAGVGRPLLTHLIWEKHNRRPVPPQHIVIQKDGNKNNFEPRNLALLSMADNCRRNSIPQRLKLDPRNPELLGKWKLLNERKVATRALNATRKARDAAALLVKQFQSGEGSEFLANLSGRNQ